MIEVFKTDVKDEVSANLLTTLIHEKFTHYKANFDLDDCDKILRIKSEDGSVCAKNIINLLQINGCSAEVLQY